MKNYTVTLRDVAGNQIGIVTSVTSSPNSALVGAVRLWAFVKGGNPLTKAVREGGATI